MVMESFRMVLDYTMMDVSIRYLVVMWRGDIKRRERCQLGSLAFGSIRSYCSRASYISVLLCFCVIAPLFVLVCVLLLATLGVLLVAAVFGKNKVW